MTALVPHPTGAVAPFAEAVVLVLAVVVGRHPA